MSDYLNDLDFNGGIVRNDTTFESNVVVEGSITHSGAVVFEDSITAEGEVTLESTLQVDGITSAAAINCTTLTTTGNVNLGNNLTVDNNSTFSGDVEAASNNPDYTFDTTTAGTGSSVFRTFTVTASGMDIGDQVTSCVGLGRTDCGGVAWKRGSSSNEGEVRVKQNASDDTTYFSQDYSGDFKVRSGGTDLLTLDGSTGDLDVLGTVTLADVDCTTLDTTAAATVGTTLDVAGVATFASSILAAANTGGTGGETAPGWAAYSDSSWTPTLTASGSNPTALNSYDFQMTAYARLGNLVIFGFQLKLDYATDITTAEKQTFTITTPVVSDFTSTVQCLGVVSFEAASSAYTAGESWGGAIRSSTGNNLSLRMSADPCTTAQYIVLHAVGIYFVLD